MSTNEISNLVYISQKISVYAGSVIFVAGIIGGIFNVIVFLTLRTFRERSCAVYLVVMSVVNLGNMMTGLLSRILISGFNMDWTLISPFYCKIRWYLLQLCVLTSFSCSYLAAIDQCMATSAHIQFRQWNTVKKAQRLMAIFIIVWMLHGIPYLVLFDLIPSSTTGVMVCTSRNFIFGQYHVFGYVVTLACILPLILTALFGILAWRNLQNATRRTVPLVRRYMDQQLTTMVLNQLLYNFVFTLPYSILNTFTSIFSSHSQDPIIAAKINFAVLMSILFYYLSFACPCYIYIFASERFRRQIIHVLFKGRCESSRKQTINNGQNTITT